MMKKVVYFILLTTLLLGPIYPQYYSSSEKLLLDLDFARFNYDETSCYVEFYYSIIPLLSKTQIAEIDTLNIDFNLYQKNKIKATTPINLDLTQYHGQENNTIKETSGLIKCVLPVGDYSIELVVKNYKEIFGEKKTSREFSLKPFIHEKITLSDLELAKSIKRSQDQSSDYYKNTLEVIPNPSSRFADSQNKIGYYIELYNVNNLSPDKNINISILVTDIDGKVEVEKSYEKNKNHFSLVEVGFLDIEKLNSGYYTILFTVNDLTENYTVFRKKLIYVDHPSKDSESQVAGNDELFNSSEFAFMPADLLDKKMEMSRYFANNQEKYVSSQLTTVEAKRKWLFSFWQNKMKEKPGLLEDVNERVRYADQNFSYQAREGWQTDRGRVYVLYGPPDERERYPSSSDTNPYEVWKYHNIQGGVEFDFIDETGFGDYKLVNSTHRNELYDPNWQNYLY